MADDLVDVGYPSDMSMSMLMSKPEDRTCYPCLCLNEHVLAALGLDKEMPPTGATMHLSCEVHVTHSHREPDGSGAQLTLDFIRMGAKDNAPEERAERWYGEHEEPDGDE